MKKPTPTIKGIFVNSHVKAVREVAGEKGVEKLEQMYGGPIYFHNREDVPVREEVKIIECALRVISGGKVSEEEVAFEAGRLHFRNFSTTPLGRILLSQFLKKFKLMMMQSKNIAGHVFKNVEFIPEDLGENSVKVTMKNNDYPLDHFKGLFQEWMNYSGVEGKVEAKNSGDSYEYTMMWK